MIPFNNLRPLHAALADELNAAAQQVLASGWYILGPQVEAFEEAFASYHGRRYAVGVANGTDALELALRAADIGAGDEVITVSHTALPTVNAIEQTGASPVLVDIDPQRYTIDPAAAEAAISPRTRAIIPVHLYGQPADLAPLQALAESKGLLLLEDCAQAHGARYRGQLVGTVGQMAAFSFYPTKNLGAYGDGGAVITDDPALAERLRRLRNYGQTSRYVYGERGINSRLDELQAALLRVKLPYLEAHNAERRQLAAQYSDALHRLSSLVGFSLPQAAPDTLHAYHLYVIRHPRRDALMAQLQEQGIGTLIHYPIPIHLQAPYADLGYPEGLLPHTEAAARAILSLPLYVGLSSAEVAQVCAAILRFSEGLA